MNWRNTLGRIKFIKRLNTYWHILITLDSTLIFHERYLQKNFDKYSIISVLSTISTNLTTSFKILTPQSNKLFEEDNRDKVLFKCDMCFKFSLRCPGTVVAHPK